jgi:hypothetical protein
LQQPPDHHQNEKEKTLMLKIKAADRRIPANDRIKLYDMLADMGVPVSMGFQSGTTSGGMSPATRTVDILGTGIRFVFKGDRLVGVED